MSTLIAGNIVTRLVGLTGLSASTINTIVPIAIAVVGIASTSYMKVTSYNSGYEAAQSDIQSGLMELDGKVIEILSDADRASLEAYDTIKATIGDYDEQSDDRTDELKRKLNEHARTLWLIQNREDPVTDWGSAAVPEHIRMRFNNLDRQRSNRGNPDTDTKLKGGPVFDDSPSPLSKTKGY